MPAGTNDHLGIGVSLTFGLLFLIFLLYLSLARGKKIGLAPYTACLGAILLMGASELAEGGYIPWIIPSAHPWLAFVAYLGLVFVFLKILDLVLVEDYFIARRELYIPHILRLLGVIVGLGLAGLVLLRLVLDVNVLALIALPTVATAVIGFALKDVIARFASGLELGRIIRVGDWVTLMGKEGVITNVTLNYVTIKTRGWDYVNLPNDAVSQTEIVNHSRPEGVTARTLTIEAGYDHPPLFVKKVLMEAAAAAPGVAPHPPPVAFVHEFKESGIEYKLRFWLTDYARRERIAGDVMAYAWYAFKRQNIELPFPKRVVTMTQPPDAQAARQAEIAEFLRQLLAIDFLAVLSEPEHRRLAEYGEKRVYMPGEFVVREGEEGAEFFVVMSGTADVEISAGGQTMTVASISTPDFFGEMSLLTGAPRSATVRATSPLTVLVVGKEAMGQVLANNHSLVERFGETLAQRQSALASHRESAAKSHKPEAGSDSRSLASRILKFFGLGRR
jgi:small-conductance mechanosensitive channel/CRP-like cAMP-binding protein